MAGSLTCRSSDRGLEAGGEVLEPAHRALEVPQRFGVARAGEFAVGQFVGALQRRGGGGIGLGVNLRLTTTLGSDGD